MADWQRKITGLPELFDKFNEGELDLPGVTEKLTELLKADQAYPSDRELRSLVEELEVFQGEHDEPYFDMIMNGLYDWADRVRVWIEPLPTRH